MSASAEALRQIKEIERHGTLIAAYDLVQDALRQFPDDLGLRHRAVLILARGGATAEAERSYRGFGLDAVTDHEDIVALGGRLLKDRALAADGKDRLWLLDAAIGKYRQARDELDVALGPPDNPRPLPAETASVLRLARQFVNHRLIELKVPRGLFNLRALGRRLAEERA